jgi:hypothetical protein
MVDRLKYRNPARRIEERGIENYREKRGGGQERGRGQS